MSTINSTLAQERLKQVLSYDQRTGLFTWVAPASNRTKPGTVLDHPNTGDGYIKIGIDGARYLAHRLAWMYVYGVWPAQRIDHINGCRSDNRIENLRDVSAQENSQNMRNAMTNTASGYLGAYKHRSKWASKIRINGKTTNLGVFDTPELANAAYISAKRIHHKTCSI